MTPDDLRAQLDRLALSGSRAASLLGVDDRTVRRWLRPPECADHRAVPEPVARLLAACERHPILVAELLAR